MHGPFKTASGVQNSGPWDPWQASDEKKNPGVPAGAVGCRIQGLGTHSFRWWKTADFSHSVGTAHGAPPVLHFGQGFWHSLAEHCSCSPGHIAFQPPPPRRSTSSITFDPSSSLVPQWAHLHSVGAPPCPVLQCAQLGTGPCQVSESQERAASTLLRNGNPIHAEKHRDFPLSPWPCSCCCHGERSRREEKGVVQRRPQTAPVCWPWADATGQTAQNRNQKWFRSTLDRWGPAIASHFSLTPRRPHAHAAPKPTPSRSLPTATCSAAFCSAADFWSTTALFLSFICFSLSLNRSVGSTVLWIVGQSGRYESQYRQPMRTAAWHGHYVHEQRNGTGPRPRPNNTSGNDANVGLGHINKIRRRGSRQREHCGYAPGLCRVVPLCMVACTKEPPCTMRP